MTVDKKTIRTLLLGAAGLIVLYWALENPAVLGSWISHFASVSFPLVLGFCIAFVLNVPMRTLEKYILVHPKKPWLAKLRRPLCILLSLLFILLVLAMVMWLVIPEIVNTIGVLATAVPAFVEGLQKWALESSANFPQLKEWIAGLEIDWASTGKTVLTFLTNGAGSLLGGTMTFVSALVGNVVNVTVGFIFALYILLDKEKLKRQTARVCRAVLPQKMFEAATGIARLASHTFSSFVSGQCIEACILGTLCWLGMALLRLPYAPMVGSLVGLSALIPIVGAFIGTGVGAFMILMISPIKAVTFVVFLLILQQIEGNIIYPKVVGSSVGLPPLWCLAAITLGGSLAGIGGMLFAVPTASVLYTLAREAVRAKLDKPAAHP